MNDFTYTIIDYINNSVRNSSMKPFNLGGITGSGGGTGTPPGGYVGYLPQTRVAYDLSEEETLDIPVSGVSLLDNLNHIRYRVNVLEESNTRIRTYTWVLNNPIVGGIPGPRMAELHTVTRVDGFVTMDTSVDFNIEERYPPASGGTDIFSSEVNVVTSGGYSTDVSNSILAEGTWLWLDISNVTGTPGRLAVTLVCEV